MAAPYPQFIPQAFAISAAVPDRNVIPAAPVTTQRASFQLGFPPIVMQPVIAGGKPMLGPDVNGILYMMSSHTVYAQSGKPYLWNADVAVAIAGYAIGTLLGSTDGLTLWYNLTAGNSSDPDAGGAGWVALFSYGITSMPPVVGGVVTLTPAQYAKNVIVLTGALVANQQVVLPTQLRRWLIVNATTGAFNLTVKTAGGSGVNVLQGGFTAPVEVWGDGTNIYNVVAPLSVPIDQAATPLTIVQRTNAGYVLATYMNQSSGLENSAMSAIFYEFASDGFHRKISPANFQAQLPLANFIGQVTNAQVPQSAVTQHSAAVLANAALTGSPTAPTQPAGTSNTLVATTAFANPPATLAVDGAAPQPSGLAYRWGTTAALGGGGTVIAFVTPFLVDCYNVQICALNTGGVAQATDSITNKTVNGFTLNNAGSVPRAFDYFAVGRDA